MIFFSKIFEDKFFFKCAKTAFLGVKTSFKIFITSSYQFLDQRFLKMSVGIFVVKNKKTVENMAGEHTLWDYFCYVNLKMFSTTVEIFKPFLNQKVVFLLTNFSNGIFPTWLFRIWVSTGPHYTFPALYSIVSVGWAYNK